LVLARNLSRSNMRGRDRSGSMPRKSAKGQKKRRPDGLRGAGAGTLIDRSIVAVRFEGLRGRRGWLRMAADNDVGRNDYRAFFRSTRSSRPRTVATTRTGSRLPSDCALPAARTTVAMNATQNPNTTIRLILWMGEAASNDLDKLPEEDPLQENRVDSAARSPRCAALCARSSRFS
jgi:hypothetical protein